MASDTNDPFAHRPRRLWRRTIVDAPAGLVEAVSEILADVSGTGVEISPAPAAADGGARERVIGYLAGDAAGGEQQVRVRAALTELAVRHGVPAGALSVRSDELCEEDWGAGWKEHFHPFHVAPRLVVKPGWEPYEAQPGEAVIEMDPGMAFGTGLHASTRLAIGFIEELSAEAAPRRVLDVGTGTGILAMAAALRGAAEVKAVDNDPDAVAAARENVSRNRLEARVAVGGELPAGAGPFDLIAANITADVLLDLAPDIAARLAPGGALVLSGLLAGEQARETRAAYERLGLLAALERVEGEWASLLLFAPAGGEVFELVDEQGLILGRAPRPVCHRSPWLTHRAAHVIVTDARGRIYLQKRSLAKDIQPGKWDTSVGGHVDAGEDHEAAARREMLEELGLVGELRFLYRYLWRTPRETELVETFLHVASEEPRWRPEEIDEGRWFTPAEAARLVESGAATPNLAEELRRFAEIS
jgi:ribosomal protein L11 methyltransferase